MAWAAGTGETRVKVICSRAVDDVHGNVFALGSVEAALTAAGVATLLRHAAAAIVTGTGDALGTSRRDR